MLSDVPNSSLDPNASRETSLLGALASYCRCCSYETVKSAIKLVARTAASVLTTVQPTLYAIASALKVNANKLSWDLFMNASTGTQIRAVLNGSSSALFMFFTAYKYLPDAWQLFLGMYQQYQQDKLSGRKLVAYIAYTFASAFVMAVLGWQAMSESFALDLFFTSFNFLFVFCTRLVSVPDLFDWVRRLFNGELNLQRQTIKILDTVQNTIQSVSLSSSDDIKVTLKRFITNAYGQDYIHSSSNENPLKLKKHNLRATIDAINHYVGILAALWASLTFPLFAAAGASGVELIVGAFNYDLQQSSFWMKFFRYVIGYGLAGPNVSFYMKTSAAAAQNFTRFAGQTIFNSTLPIYKRIPVSLGALVFTGLSYFAGTMVEEPFRELIANPDNGFLAVTPGSKGAQFFIVGVGLVEGVLTSFSPASEPFITLDPKTLQQIDKATAIKLLYQTPLKFDDVFKSAQKEVIKRIENGVATAERRLLLASNSSPTSSIEPDDGSENYVELGCDPKPSRKFLCC